MTHGSLFSGIGGFDLAAEWMGWDNMFHCEIDKFCQNVLNYWWPNAILYDDIKTTDFTIYRGRIDILTGGFPCQPFSLAGKRKGTADDRHLWPEMLRSIREIKPRWVVGENVFGIVNWDGGLVFEQVQSDLENEGYEVQPYILPAASVNAPHKRDRVWFVAKNTVSSGCLHGEPNEERTEFRKFGKSCTGNTNGICGTEVAGTVINTVNSGYWDNGGQDSETDRIQKFSRSSLHSRMPYGTDTRIASYTDINERCKGGVHKTGSEKTKRHISTFDSRCSRRTWQDFPTQSPVCSRNDGISYGLDGITFSKWRNESIKAYGNSVVPQLVYQIFKAIEQYENA